MTIVTTRASDQIIHTIWISRLPTQTQAILTPQKNLELNQLTDITNAIAKTSKQHTYVAQVNKPKENNDLAAQVGSLTSKMEREREIRAIPTTRT